MISRKEMVKDRREKVHYVKIVEMKAKRGYAWHMHEYVLLDN